MDKQIEKKIEKQVGKQVVEDLKKEVNKEVQKEVAKEVERVEADSKKDLEKEVEKIKEGAKKDLNREVKRVEKEIRKEVEKKMGVRFYEGAISSAMRFNKEFREQIAVAITAAFAFLIALSWREPIQISVDKLVVDLGLKGGEIYLQFLSALVITLIGVLILMLVSKWKIEEENKEK